MHEGTDRDLRRATQGRSEERSVPAGATHAGTSRGGRKSGAGGALSQRTLERFNEDFETNPAYRTIQNAVTNITVDDVALNRRAVTRTDHTFSHQLDDWSVTNQKASGRCWLFAGLNLFRAGAMKEMNVKDFEFSQNYVLFWDKLERANFFLESIIETADREADDRTVAFLLDKPLVDGGQWHMFVNIVSKYGLAPQAFMPETQSSSSTRRMNSVLYTVLRRAARELRELSAGSAPLERIRERKEKTLSVIHRILSIHLGTPPTQFVWQWTDKDRKFHREENTTPVEFARRHLGVSPDQYVCLVNDPRPSHPYGRTYTVDYLGNVVGGEPVLYLNVPIERMKELSVQALRNEEPVWFGCDMGKMMHRKLGLMDGGLFEYERVYDAPLDMDKAARLEYHQSSMSHAMLFTGVDLLDETPRRWRVENSWGDEYGRKGFFVMNESWFDAYMFEIAVRRSYLSESELRALVTEPVRLPPWDPMGALAG